MGNGTDVSSSPLPEVDERQTVTSDYRWIPGSISRHHKRPNVGTAIYGRDSEPTINSIPEIRTEALSSVIRANWFAISGVSVEIYDQISRIANLREGWAGPYSQPLNSLSLRHFLKFWEEVCDSAADPELVMTTSGSIYAEWHKNWNRHLDIEFCDNGKVFYGLFDGTSTHEGIGRISEIVAFLRGRENNPLGWC